MNKHTPGPWKVDGDETPWTEGDAELAVEYNEPFGTTSILFSVSRAVPGEEELVARLPWEPGADDKRQAELRANARLIAAAPELLEALEAMLRGADLVAAETFDGGKQFPTLMLASAKAQAAIAKAEETP